MNKYFKMATTLCLVVMALTTATAQPDYESAMGSALQSLAEARTTADFIAAANQFDQIGEAAPDQWLPPYYAAYCQLVGGLHESSVADKDGLFDQALAQIERAAARTGDNSEVYALNAYIQFMRMTVDPQTRLYLMADAGAMLEKASQLDPSNPRPDFINGQNVFYTPVEYGGGASAAKPLLLQAKKKFAAFKPDGTFAPNWGADRCDALLAEIGDAK